MAFDAADTFRAGENLGYSLFTRKSRTRAFSAKMFQGAFTTRQSAVFAVNKGGVRCAWKEKI